MEIGVGRKLVGLAAVITRFAFPSQDRPQSVQAGDKDAESMRAGCWGI